MLIKSCRLNQLTHVPGAMLSNFLEALSKTGAMKKVRRIILTTGAKQYGLQLGAVKNPMQESDAWVEGPDRPPNFYYNQQNILKSYTIKENWDWVVTYPNDVLGLAKNNFMNLVTSLALYALVSKELSGELPFPGSEVFYTSMTTFTSAALHAQFCIWAAREPKCSNQGFNVVNGDVESWQNLWPRVAEYFGCRVPPKQFASPPDEKEKSEMPLAPVPPIADTADKLGLVGTDLVKQSVLKQRIDLVKWSQRDDVKKAWESVAKRDGLEHEAFEKATWGFLGFVLGRQYDIVVSMSKARKYGWTGYMDTWEVIEGLFDELPSLGVLPKKK